MAFQKGISLFPQYQFKKGHKPTNGFKKGHPSYHTEKSKRKIGDRLKGRQLSENHKRHLEKPHKGIPWNKGKTKRDYPQLSNSGVKKGETSKENHWNWQGGKSFEPYTIDWTESLRRTIRERDKYICQLCEKSQGDRAHSIHHIDYIKSNCNPNNLITLCVNCNSKVNKNRNYWTDYFNKCHRII